MPLDCPFTVTSVTVFAMHEQCWDMVETNDLSLMLASPNLVQTNAKVYIYLSLIHI